MVAFSAAGQFQSALATTGRKLIDLNIGKYGSDSPIDLVRDRSAITPKYAQDTWDQLQFVPRTGKNPQVSLSHAKNSHIFL
jgi:hypothetical protein